jgi:hypothetical protein
MNQLRSTPQFPDTLGRSLEPVGELMPVDFAQKLVALRATSQVKARIDEPADRCHEGEHIDY